MDESIFLIYEEFNRPDDEKEYPRSNVIKILEMHPDYRPGPVKFYTKQEIKDYERTN